MNNAPKLWSIFHIIKKGYVNGFWNTNRRLLYIILCKLIKQKAFLPTVIFAITWSVLRVYGINNLHKQVSSHAYTIFNVSLTLLLDMIMLFIHYNFHYFLDKNDAVLYYVSIKNRLFLQCDKIFINRHVSNMKFRSLIFLRYLNSLPTCTHKKLQWYSTLIKLYFFISRNKLVCTECYW